MSTKAVLIVSAIFLTRISANIDVTWQSEPKCHSRFDYDLKVVENIGSLKAAQNDLKENVAALQEAVKKLQDTLKKPRPVAFMAQLSSNMEVEPLVQVHRPIIFDQVSVNVGDSYNRYTGVFTAPETAVFHFNLDVSSPPLGPPSHKLHIHLLENGQQIGYIFLDDHAYHWLRRATAVTVQLDAGDSIKAVVVRSVGSKANTVAGFCFHTQFSGFLVGSE